MAKLSLRSNRKFRRLVALVRIDAPAHLKGHLTELWETSWENGTPLIGDFDDIEAAAGWPMANEEKYPRLLLAGALVAAGFVDTVVEGKLYAIHDWYDHAPEFVKKRVSRAAKEDPTVGHETHFLGLDAWRRRAAALGVVVSLGSAAETGDETEADLPHDSTSEEDKNENGSRSATSSSETAAARRTNPRSYPRNGCLSRRAEPRQAERSEVGLLSPTPLSPPPLSPLSSTLWDRAKEILAENLPHDEFRTWIGPLVPYAEYLDGLKLHAPNQRFAYTVAESFGGTLDAALSLAADRPMSVEVTA